MNTQCSVFVGKSPEGSRTPSGKRSDLRARYWAYLFENLSRAVDEIYVTCETDDSTLECKVNAWVIIVCLIRTCNLYAGGDYDAGAIYTRFQIFD